MPDKCRDCGDVLGTGSFCGRCKWMASGKAEAGYYPPRQLRGSNGCGHVQCDCPDGVFYGRDEVSDADPGL